MLVSIITATFNSKKYIMDTYNSIIKQTYTNWEWIVTDDCSTDDTYEILKSISACDSRVKVFLNGVNSGAAVSRNNCLDHASGLFISFLDSDDLWEPAKLESQVDFINKTNVNFCFTSYAVINESGFSIGITVDDQDLNSVSYQDMLKKKATLGCSTVMIRRSFINDKRMPLLRTGQDYAFWLSLLKEGELAYLLRKPLTQYRITPGSISRNKIKKCKRQWEIYRIEEKLGLLMSLYCFIFYAYRAIFRR
ncbi:glycosyltransferase family 2 protein [Aeromonas caviae]|uniref:glycosyltransferase family 2 protein n=1 Tax=Aeromonas caviae TaxID=648 RepID=UPI0029DDEAF8|nr:glycosyltransferase family 2 protein [Aeromonas caviae]MDX7949437.1 glycosyltransferase family 2 protein [Aeromonas caviae]